MDGTENDTIYSEDSQELDDDEELEDEFETDSEYETDGERIFSWRLITITHKRFL